MTVTGVLLAITSRDDVWIPAAARAGIGDSKSLCAHGSMRDVERFVLAVADAHLGARPRSLAELLGVIGHESDGGLRALCPAGEAPRACFEHAIELPAFDGAPRDEDLDSARRLLDSGVRVLETRVSLSCAKRLNVASRAGKSRFDVDLDAMLSIIARLRATAGAELDVGCGKVGGRKSYGPALTALHPLPETVEESQARSAYRLRSIGTVAFVRDGDATDPAISLASLFGKYVRELTMERIYRYYASHVAGVGRASGYHDPVTTRFIEATALTRKRLEIADECFSR